MVIKSCACGHRPQKSKVVLSCFQKRLTGSELISFPNSKHDDQVHSTVFALAVYRHELLSFPNAKYDDRVVPPFLRWHGSPSIQGGLAGRRSHRRVWRVSPTPFIGRANFGQLRGDEKGQLLPGGGATIIDPCGVLTQMAGGLAPAILFTSASAPAHREYRPARDYRWHPPLCECAPA